MHNGDGSEFIESRFSRDYEDIGDLNGVSGHRINNQTNTANGGENHIGSLLLGWSRTLSHVTTTVLPTLQGSSGAIQASMTSVVATVIPMVVEQHLVMDGGGNMSGPVKERSPLDLGRFLGFPSLEKEHNKSGNVPSVGSLPAAASNDRNAMRRSARKYGRWVSREKGKKNLSNGDQQLVGDGDTDVGGQGGSRVLPGGGCSFASIVSGMPDFNSLPEPVIEGGIVSVVIPQAAY
ncbi:hypothetical protein NE237_028825 [Protea cynaroides]|uniref:Uncharacterized protein n=1 Tax=Protea cynaroides TaxID=273540 RepID=A0A9Q0JVN5_9MAGN|nr:hypothetical protein NE237_028825 [Protea cynaroides]